jgi:hypothetical protein
LKPFCYKLFSRLNRTGKITVHNPVCFDNKLFEKLVRLCENLFSRLTRTGKIIVDKLVVRFVNKLFDKLSNRPNRTGEKSVDSPFC